MCKIISVGRCDFPLLLFFAVTTTLNSFVDNGWSGVNGQLMAPASPPMCPGPCVSLDQCSFHGGRTLGPCGRDRVCCEHGGDSGTCGHVVRGRKLSSFKSPLYPDYSSGSLICKFDVELDSSTTGVRIDFLHLEMDSTPVGNNFQDVTTPACDSDMFFIKGFKDWSPDPRCGNLTGYSTMVELEPGQPALTIVFVMSSFAYKWHVRLTTISHVEIQQAGQILDNKIFMSTRSPSSPSIFPNGRLPSRPMLNVNMNPRDPNDHVGRREEVVKGVPLIGGGEDAKPLSVPWQASIQSVRQIPLTMCGEPKNMSVHFCGGSIIDDTTILSAAHCYLSPAKYPHPLSDLSLMKVVVGEHDLCHVDEVPTTMSFPVASIIFHFNYLSTEIINDVAIIKLSRRIQFNEGVQPIPLAYPGIQIKGMTPLLSGWGSYGTQDDGNISYPRTLQITSALEILSDTECMTSTLNYLKLNPHNRLSYKYRSGFNRGVCTKGNGNGIIEAGFGDSGGPLAVKDSTTSRHYLIGIVSHKRPEKDEQTSQKYNMNYFGKVADYANWILMGLVPI